MENGGCVKVARLMFEMYAQPSTSFGDIARHFADEGILIYDKELTSGTTIPGVSTSTTP